MNDDNQHSLDVSTGKWLAVLLRQGDSLLTCEALRIMGYVGGVLELPAVQLWVVPGSDNPTSIVAANAEAKTIARIRSATDERTLLRGSVLSPNLMLRPVASAVNEQEELLRSLNTAA